MRAEMETDGKNHNWLQRKRNKASIHPHQLHQFTFSYGLSCLCVRFSLSVQLRTRWRTKMCMHCNIFTSAGKCVGNVYCDFAEECNLFFTEWQCDTFWLLAAGEHSGERLRYDCNFNHSRIWKGSCKKVVSHWDRGKKKQKRSQWWRP